MVFIVSGIYFFCIDVCSQPNHKHIRLTNLPTDLCKNHHPILIVHKVRTQW